MEEEIRPYWKKAEEYLEFYIDAYNRHRYGEDSDDANLRNRTFDSLSDLTSNLIKIIKLEDEIIDSYKRRLK